MGWRIFKSESKGNSECFRGFGKGGRSEDRERERAGVPLADNDQGRVDRTMTRAGKLMMSGKMNVCAACNLFKKMEILIIPLFSCC